MTVMIMVEEAPKYIRLAHDLRGRIRAGWVAPGDYLPSEADMAIEADVGRATLRRALEVLEAEGLVERRQGYRTRVRAPGNRQSAVARPGDVIRVRRPTVEERVTLGLSTGEQILEVAGQPYPADRWEAVVTAGESPTAEGDDTA